MITSECRRIESPRGDLCLNQSFADANIDTIKNNGSPKRDESLITSVCQRIENPFEIKSKGIQKHVDPPIISVCQPVEELCSTANTDVDNHMASELSRLRNENRIYFKEMLPFYETKITCFVIPAKSYQLNWKNAKLNLKFGIRLKKLAQKRKTTHNQKGIRHPLIPSPT